MRSYRCFSSTCDSMACVSVIPVHSFSGPSLRYDDFWRFPWGGNISLLSLGSAWVCISLGKWETACPGRVNNQKQFLLLREGRLFISKHLRAVAAYGNCINTFRIVGAYARLPRETRGCFTPFRRNMKLSVYATIVMLCSAEIQWDYVQWC